MLNYRNFFSSRLRLQTFIFSQQRLSCIAERAPWDPTIELYSSAILDHVDFRLHMEIGSDFLSWTSSCLCINDIRIFRSSKLYVLRVPFRDADAILPRTGKSIRLFRSLSGRFPYVNIKPNSDRPPLVSNMLFVELLISLGFKFWKILCKLLLV